MPIAGPVFVNALKQMQIEDARAILTGPDNQLTWYQTYPTYILDTPAEALLNIYDDEPALP